jgi:hypothetical protein
MLIINYLPEINNPGIKCFVLKETGTVDKIKVPVVKTVYWP